MDAKNIKFKKQKTKKKGKVIYMKSIKRKTTNTIFKRPDCFDLPGTKYKYEDETPAIETCWQLSKEELEKVKKTGKIYIQQEGETLPPMAVSASSVLADGEEDVQ